eukprot:TRINITY_DN505_c0_g1_i1.p1 TRINITY_DN505_c0_g1~~TRINITY_DN505_c0_g1_i1.p1  ORF type:complete len:496 (+),score=192.49 TRINITY_DN505_c0_g1_i1:109-1596(+)
MMMSARMMSSVRTTTVLNRSSLLQKRGYAMIAGWGDPLPRTSLGEFFEGVPEQQGLPNLPRSAEVTTLPNGLRVASLSSNFPGVSLGLFVNAGARNETRDGAGAAHYLKYMAFRSTTQRYGIEVVRDLEVLGANLSSSVGREHLLFSTEVLPHDVTNTIHQLKELLEPKLAHHEVVRAREHVEEDAERLVSCPITSLIETVHREAYRSKGLGHSIVAPQYNLGNIDNQVLRQFVQSHYSPSQSVFVVVGGVAHKDIVQQVQASFSESAVKSTSASSSAPEASKYTGGDNLTPEAGNTHVAIAFEGVSAKSDVKDVLAAGILRQILGEGMNGANKDNRLSGSSRLTNTVLSSNPSVHSIATFNFVYSDSGLFGVYAETSKNPAELVQTIASELSKLAKSEVDAKELAKGKAMYKAEILTQHGEQRHSALKFIGDQVLTRGKVVTPEEYAKQIDSVTAADLNRVAKKILSSNPTLCASGDVAGFPSSVDVKSFVSSK